MVKKSEKGKSLKIVFPSKENRTKFKTETAKREKSMTGAIFELIRKNYPAVFK